MFVTVYNGIPEQPTVFYQLRRTWTNLNRALEGIHANSVVDLFFLRVSLVRLFGGFSW